MTEINVPACPTHGARPRALHSESFQGIVEVIEELIGTVSGVGTVSYSRCAYGYPWNFEGVVRALEDLNTSISGIQGGGGGIDPSGILAGSGVYVQPSGSAVEIGINLIGLGGVDVTYSGDFAVISGATSTASVVVSGVTGGNGIVVTTSGDTAIISTNLRGEGLVDFGYNAGVGVVSGITNTVLSGANTSVTYSGIYTVINGSAGGGGGGTASGTSVIVSGDPGVGYTAGTLWFDTNQGRLFVYASGNGIADPAWYQTNAEALAYKSELPPSGTGLTAPPRDGSLWFNSLMGNLFIYDATSSGWYESGPSRSFAYSAIAPSNAVQGAGWVDSSTSTLKVWTGTGWADVV
jgi:hypothetical protein